MPIFVEHWGEGNFQFYPIFNIGGMYLDHDFFRISKLSEDQKEKSSPKIEEFFSPISSKDQKKVQRPSSAQIQTIIKLLGGMRMQTTVKSLGGCSQIIGGDIFPLSPPGFGTPGARFEKLLELFSLKNLQPNIGEEQKKRSSSS